MHRQWFRAERPEITRPEMILPESSHPAFQKAAHYFDVVPVRVPVRGDFRADLEATKAAIKSSQNSSRGLSRKAELVVLCQAPYNQRYEVGSPASIQSRSA